MRRCSLEVARYDTVLTSQAQRAGFPLTFELREFGGGRRSWVKISQIRTLSTQRIGKKLGRVSPEELDQIIAGLQEIIDG